MENGEDAVAMEQQNADGVEQVADVEVAETPTKTAQPSALDDIDQLQLVDNAEHGDQATTSESSQQQNGGQSSAGDTDEQQLQNGAPSAVEGDVGQLINLEDDDRYRVEVRQQTEQTSHTAEHVYQHDGTEEISEDVTKSVVKVNEEHKTEEHHEAQTLSSPVVNGADKADESEDAAQTAAADTEQPASAEAGPSTDQTETADEAKTKDKGGKPKGFMGFLKSKTRSHSKEREQASDKDKDAQKSKTESEEEDGSKKGASLEHEHKQFKISLFSKKTEDKKLETDETQQQASDGEKDAEKHKTPKFSLFGKKKDKPPEEADEHKGESKEEPVSEKTENVEESQTKPKEKKWFHFGKKSSKDTSAVVGDAHPYEELAEEAQKGSEENATEQEDEPEAVKEEPENLEKEEKTMEEEASTAGGALASPEAEMPENSTAAVDEETITDVTDEKQTEVKEELHTEEVSSDVSPGGTLTSKTDSKDTKVHKKFSFGIKFNKKQKVSKSESSEDTKENKDSVSAENETAKHEHTSEQAKDEEHVSEGAKQKKQKLFSFGKLTKSKSKDESDMKCEKQTEDSEQKLDDVAEEQNKDGAQQEDIQDIPEAEAEATEVVDTQKTESDKHEPVELKQADDTVESCEILSVETKTDAETDAVVESMETTKEAEKEATEEDKKDEITTREASAKGVSEPEVKKDKKEPKKFSFGIKFGHKKDDKTEDEAPEDALHKQKETKWSPFSKKPAKKASDEPAKVDDESHKREDNDESDKADAVVAAEATENTEANESAESGKAEETKETKEEKTINIRLPKLFSFGKKDALTEDKNIAQESKDESADGGEAAEVEAETEKQDEEHADKQTDGDKKEGSKMSSGIRKFFSMGRREKEGETKQEEAVAAEEKDEEAKAADTERKSSPESKHRQRSKSPHKRFTFDIKFGKKKEKSETNIKENVETVQTSDGDVIVSQSEHPEDAASPDVQTEPAAMTQQPDSTEAKETVEVQQTAVEEEMEIKVSTSSQQESAPPVETPNEPAAAEVPSEPESSLPAEAGQETATKPDEDEENKEIPAAETQSTPASDAGKPAARGRRFPFPFKFGRRSDRAKSAERTATTTTEDTAASAASGGRAETVKKMMETSASVPDVHLHATSYDENQAAEEDKPKAEEAAETTEETSIKTKESHVHIGIKWPHFGGKKSQKQDDQKEKEAVDANEPVEHRPTADDSQLSADDSSTPKSKKSLLGKGIFRIFSPRRDLQKSLTMDADGRDGVISYSVEGEGQIMATDTEWRSKTASLDSKGRIPKSSTTGADQTEMVAVVADTSTDTGRCEVDGVAAGSHLVVVAIDFGTTYSGYAFSFANDARSATTQIHMMRRWEGGDPGVVNQKTPTTILLTPSKQFHSFGFTARDFYHDLDQAEANKWLYFEKFKMNLHHCKELNSETTIAASNGERFPAVELFSFALRYFKEHALKELSAQSATIIVNEDVRWVITVPAIWRAPAKQLMRHAAYEAGIASADCPDNLLIALEPEAASIYVRQLRLSQLVPERHTTRAHKDEAPAADHVVVNGGDGAADPAAVEFRTGTRYMVVDCGGGTVDITVHEMENESAGNLRELYKAAGGPHGSTGIDAEFEKLLGEIFGVDFIETFKAKRPAGWVDLMIAFESRKRAANPHKTSALNISLPFSFIDFHKKHMGTQAESAIKKYGDKDIHWSMQGMLRLMPAAMMRLFQPTLDNIKNAIAQVFASPDVTGLEYLFLVGGFAESPILQFEIRREFEHRVKIVIPQEVSLTILKGAVCFGLDPTVVTVRKARLTYGVGVMNRFLRGVHPESKLVRRRDVDWCLDVFDRFVIVDRPVSLGDTVLRRYTPAEPDQAVIVIHIYSSETPDVRFVTDPGVQQCGTLRLDLSPAGADQAADRSSTLLSAGARRREIQTRMMFGDTEIKVSALDVVSGRSVRAAIDFLNK